MEVEAFEQGEGPVTASFAIMLGVWRPRLASGAWGVFVPITMHHVVLMLSRWFKQRAIQSGLPARIPARLNLFVVGFIGNLMHIIHGNGRDSWQWGSGGSSGGGGRDNQQWGGNQSQGSQSNSSYQEWMPRAYRGVKDKLEQCQDKLTKYEAQEQADRMGKMVQDTVNSSVSAALG
eukprot:7330438-Alexandrium_andersonii.AAC.1